MVIVLKGKNKGKIGKILKTVTFLNNGKFYKKLVVSGLNFVKKCVKRDLSKNKQGFISEKEAPISFSNVALINKSNKKGERVGFFFNKEGEKLRIMKKSKEIVI